MSDLPLVLTQFLSVARPLMRKYMSAYSCIASTRVAVDTLTTFGLRCRPQPVKMVVEIPSQQRAYSAGLTQRERDTARESFRVPGVPDGWDGHLVAAVDRWVIDCSFDQAFDGLQLPCPDDPILAFPVEPEIEFARMRAELGLRLDNGLDLQVTYVATDNHGYLETDAWNDEGLPILVDEIARAVLRRARKEQRTA